jgi:peptidoglycan/LPS O-acetylase OafA/YrhL
MISTLRRLFAFGPRTGDAANERRYSGLDGLRGVASAVVVVHHCLLVSPALSSAYIGPEFTGGIWESILVHSPLHLLWAGPEAVIVFFLLSGFVLTLPVMHARRYSWKAYFPKRILRMYVPVVGSVALALLTVVLVPRVSRPELSEWINIHDERVRPLGIVRDIFLLTGTSGLNTPLWSLRWEVFFSLLLPIYCYLAVKNQRLWIPGAAGLIIVSEVGRILDSPALTFLPMFGVGVLMAANQNAVRRWGEPVKGWGTVSIAAVSLLLLSCSWYVPGMSGTVGPAILGGCGLLFICITSKRANAFGNQPAVHWLGSRSFSLYLVHEPLIVSAALLMNTPNPVLVMAVTVPASLLLAEVFFRLVEDPSRRLANRAGRAAHRPEPSVANAAV